MLLKNFVLIKKYFEFLVVTVQFLMVACIGAALKYYG